MPKLTKEIIDNLIQEAMLQEKFPTPPAGLDLKDLKAIMTPFSVVPTTARKEKYLNAFKKLLNAAGVSDTIQKATRIEYIDTLLKIMKGDGEKDNLSYDDIKSAYELIRTESKATSEKYSLILKGLTGLYGNDVKLAHDTNIFIIDSFRTQSNLGSYMHNSNFVPTQAQIEEYSVFQAGLDVDPSLATAQTTAQQKQISLILI